MADTKAEIVKAGDNFYYCSECKNASNVAYGVPHSAQCSYGKPTTEGTAA